MFPIPFALALAAAFLAEPEGSLPAPTPEEDAADKIVCRTVQPPTGTRIRNARNRPRICMTAADWEEQEEEARFNAREVRDTGIRNKEFLGSDLPVGGGGQPR